MPLVTPSTCRIDYVTPLASDNGLTFASCEDPDVTRWYLVGHLCTCSHIWVSTFRLVLSSASSLDAGKNGFLCPTSGDLSWGELLAGCSLFGKFQARLCVHVVLWICCHETLIWSADAIRKAYMIRLLIVKLKSSRFSLKAHIQNVIWTFAVGNAGMTQELMLMVYPWNFNTILLIKRSLGLIKTSCMQRSSRVSQPKPRIDSKVRSERFSKSDCFSQYYPISQVALSCNVSMNKIILIAWCEPIHFDIPHNYGICLYSICITTQ